MAALLPMLTGPASAQLANGPWPMFRHDVCHTGQSPNPGPRFTSAGPADEDVQKWTGYDKIRTSPALSKDGHTLYLGQGRDFCSVDTGTMTTNDCWQLPTDVSDSSPAVAEDGTIYIGDRDNTLSAFRPLPNGQLDLKWAHNRGHEGDIWTSPSIAPVGVPAAGTIYFAHDLTTVPVGVGMFTALIDQPDPTTGKPYTVKWMHAIGKAVRQSSPAIDKNGLIYLGDLLGNLYAFKDNGPGDVTQCWTMTVGSGEITASPVISPDSTTLYIGTTAAGPATPAKPGIPAVPGIPMGLTALDISSPACPAAAPPIKWTFATTANFEGAFTGGKVDQSPALAHDGNTLYVPVMNGGKRSLYAVDAATGDKKWRFGPISSGAATSGHPIVGSDGTVYVGIYKTLYALDSAGTQLWTYSTTNSIESSPLIGPVTGGKAVVYVPSRDHNLYAISGPPSGTARATSCWTADPTGGGGPAPFIRLLSPNGGEQLPVGSVQSISWESSGLPGSVRIHVIRAGVATLLTGQAANTGVKLWTVPGPAQGSVRIRVTANPPTSGITDKSDMGFTITP